MNRNCSTFLFTSSADIIYENTFYIVHTIDIFCPFDQEIKIPRMNNDEHDQNLLFFECTNNSLLIFF